MMLTADIRLRQGAFTLDASITASSGITVLFGPSGSGKSTLLAALTGLKPSEGRITVSGRVLDSLPPHRRGVGLVFQEARLFPHLTVRQNIAYARKRAVRPRAMEEVARFFDIATLLERPIANLSGGEKSRVALARALMASPDMLLLDEPFAALDGKRRRAFIGVLLRLHREFDLPMMVVSHNIDDAAALASHVIALTDGRVAASGPFVEISRTAPFQALLDTRDVGAAVSSATLVSGRGPADEAVWLRADHVLLATEHPRAISARNILQGKITAIAAESDSSQLITLETEVGSILSRITPRASAELKLAPGKTAWALVKAHAL